MLRGSQNFHFVNIQIFTFKKSCDFWMEFSLKKLSFGCRFWIFSKVLTLRSIKKLFFKEIICGLSIFREFVNKKPYIFTNFRISLLLHPPHRLWTLQFHYLLLSFTENSFQIQFHCIARSSEQISTLSTVIFRKKFFQQISTWS